VLVLGFFACNSVNNKREAISFYYWKSTYRLTAFEVEYLKKQKVSKIYLHCFDVTDNQGAPLPEAVLLWADSLQPGIEYIPTVFIENSLFTETDSAAVRTLADRVQGLCSQILAHKQLSLSEIQIDCDWTKTSRDQYFYFLTLLKQKKLMVSNTLRLYQYKYRTDAGIAPTDFASLMCYNMGNMQNRQAQNSILNRKDLQAYISSQKAYPKPLNIALPIFKWTLLYKQQCFKGILYQHPDLNNGNWKQISATQYLCTHAYADSMCDATFYKDDLLRIEEISKHDLAEALALIHKHVKNSKNEIIYFDLDSSKIHHTLY
jgi:hypothetical protein